MRTNERHKLAAMMTAVLLAAAKAMAQEQQAATPDECEFAPPVRRIVISIADRKLAVIENGRIVRVYETAVGASATPTPSGVFTIANRVKNPTWYGPHGQVVPPGKTNPLGDRWMGLSLKGYGIHGTNNPASIGRNASHGCIRMRREDVHELFDMMRVGDTVELMTEPNEELARVFRPAALMASAE